MSPRHVSALVVLTLGACAPGTDAGVGEDLGPIQEWPVDARPLVSIGVVQGDPHYEFDDVTSVARLPDGRIAVANNGSGEVRFFGPDGSFIRAVGRAGDGPEEYRILDRIRVVGNDTILVLDTYQRRKSMTSARPGCWVCGVTH